MKDQRQEKSNTPVRDYDRDRYGYDRPASSPRRHGHSRFADKERDAWQGASPTYDPKRPDGRPPRTAPTLPALDAHDERPLDAAADAGAALRADAAPVSVVSVQARSVDDSAGPDELLRAEICERLASLDGYDLGGVEVLVVAGQATLTGTVPTRETKYEAERVADAVPGVRDVVNQIRVRYEARV